MASSGGRGGGRRREEEEEDVEVGKSEDEDGWYGCNGGLRPRMRPAI
jgi:hypothetical protein